MKTIVGKIFSKWLICKFVGHKWKINHIYGASAVVTCKRCLEHRHDLISELL